MWRVWQWPVWELRKLRGTGPLALAFVVAVILTGYSGLALTWLSQSLPSSAQVVLASLLALAGIAHTEIVVHLERVRASDTPGRAEHTDLTSVVTFAAVVALPPALAVSVSALVHLHVSSRLRLSDRVAYKVAFTNAAIVLAALASAAAITVLRELLSPAGPQLVLAVAGGLVVYYLVNTGLLLVVVGLTTRTLRKRIGDDRIELATMSLGALVGMLLVTEVPGPLAALLFVPPILYMVSLAASNVVLEERALAEEPTGLANHARWIRDARRLFHRATHHHRAVGVLRIDIDRMTEINGRYGLDVADRVVGAVARALEDTTRPDDLLGRLTGSDEFLVLLVGLDDLEAVAKRIVAAVADLYITPSAEPDPRDTAADTVGTFASDGEARFDSLDADEQAIAVSVCVGGAQFPHNGVRLDELEEAAGVALAEARRAGPGTVALGSKVVDQAYRSTRRHSPS